MIKKITATAVFFLIGAGWAQGQVAQSGLVAEYRFVNCNGSAISNTTLPDCSGHGLNGTLTNHGGSGKPAADGTGLSFDHNSHHTVDLPDGALSNVVTIQIAADWGNPVVQSNLGQWPYFGDVSNGFNITAKPYSTDEVQGCGISPNSGAGQSAGLGAPWGPTLCTVVLSSTTDVIYVNATKGTGYRMGLKGGNLNSTKTGIFQFGGSTARNEYYNGKIYYAVFYDRALSDAEVAANWTYISSVLTARGLTLRPPNSSATNQLVFHGDSLTNGTGGGTPYSAYVSPAGTWQKSTHGIPGATCAEIGENKDQVMQHLAAAAAKNVAVLWCGTNNSQNQTPAQALNELSAAAATYRSAGFKVVVGSMISGVGTVNGGITRDEWKNQFNALVKAGWSGFADGLADLASDAVLGADGAYTNSTYFTDQLHLTDTGYRRVAAMMQTAIDGLGTPVALPWFNPGWPYRKIRAIDHRRVLGTFSDFAVLIQIDNDSDMAGHLQTACQDFLVTLADGTKLDHEILQCDAAAGTVHAFVRVPSLSPAADTPLYIYYGNPNASDQSNPRGVWNSGYKAVLHFKGGAAADSTSNALNATAHGSPVKAAGVFGDALQFDGLGAYLTTATAPVSSAYTLQIWYKADTAAAGAALTPVAGTGNGAFGIGWNGPTPGSFYHGAAAITFAGDTTPGSSRWYSAAESWDGSGVTTYLDGSLKTTAAATTLGSFTNGLYIGGNGSLYFRGWIAEVRLSNVARPRAWIATEYYNQAHPETFFITGRQQTNTAAAPVIDLFTASYGSVEPGKPTSLQWLVSNASTVTIDQGVGAQTGVIAGSASVSPAATTTYTLTAINGQGTTTAAVTVTTLTGAPVAYFRASGPAGTWIHDYAIDGSNHAVIHTSEPHNLVAGDYVGQWGSVSTDAANNYASNLNGHFLVKDVLDAGHYTVADMSGAYVTPNAPWKWGGENPTYGGANWAGKVTPFPLVAGPRGILDGTNGPMMRHIAAEPVSLTVAGGTATVDLGYSHDVRMGDTISVWNTTAGGNLNGEHTVTSAGATTFTFATNSSAGDYTANNRCGPSASDPHVIGGTENCVRISQYAINSNVWWGPMVTDTNYNSPADYKHTYDGGTCQYCGVFAGDFQWKFEESAYRFLVDRRNQAQLDAVMYAYNNIERFGGVGWAVSPFNGSDEGGDQGFGHYGFGMTVPFSLIGAAGRIYATAAERQAYADKMFNDVWYLPSAGLGSPATQIFPDHENVTTGTAQGGSGTTIELAAEASPADNFYVGNIVAREHVTDEAYTDVVWFGTVTAYTGATRTATVNNIQWIHSRSSAVAPVPMAAWPVPASGSAYRVLATATMSGNTVTGVNTHFTTDFQVGDAVLLDYTWKNQWPYSSSYVAQITDDTHLTVIKGPAPPAPTTPTPIFVVPKWSQARHDGGFHWRMAFTSGWQGARPIMYQGGGRTTATDTSGHNMPTLDQNVGGFQTAWDVAVGAALAEDDQRGLLIAEKGQSYQWDWSYRFSLMYRGGFTSNGVWYGMDNDLLGMGQWMSILHAVAPTLPMPGLTDEFLTNVQRIKTYITLPDHPGAFGLIQQYGSNNANSQLAANSHFGFDWLLDYGAQFAPFSLTSKYLNQFNGDAALVASAGQGDREPFNG